MADVQGSFEEGFRYGLAELLVEMPELEKALQDIAAEEAVEYGRTAARQAVAPALWRMLAGEVLSTEQVRELLGVSRQALNKRVTKGTLLGLPGERTTLFPAWQFDASGEVRPAVSVVLREFRDRLGDDVDPRIVLSWASARQPELEGEAPADWIRADGDTAALKRAAERAAEALAR